MSVRSHNGFTYHGYGEADFEEVTAAFHLKGRLTPGVGYARKSIGKQRPSKDRGRSRIAAFYHSKKWPMPLRILTMPGAGWRFEKELLSTRGIATSPSYKGQNVCPEAETSIISVEHDEMIFRAALKNIPAGNQGLSIIGTRAVRTEFIERFIAMDVEEYISHSLCPYFDAAWLDFTGPLTSGIMQALHKFWPKCGLHLTVTSLKARWSKMMSQNINRVGNISEYLAGELGANILADYKYVEKVPMHQVTLVKKYPSMNYFGYDPYPYDTIYGLLGINPDR